MLNNGLRVLRELDFTNMFQQETQTLISYDTFRYVPVRTWANVRMLVIQRVVEIVG